MLKLHSMFSNIGEGNMFQLRMMKLKVILLVNTDLLLVNTDLLLVNTDLLLVNNILSSHWPISR